MPRVIINGTLGQISEPIEVDFDPVRGMIIHQRIKSAGDNLAGWFNVLTREGIACRWKRSPVVSTIDLTYSGGAVGFADEAQENWQLLGNEIQISIYESNFALNAEAAQPGTISKARNVVRALESGEIDLSSINPDDPDAPTFVDLIAGFLNQPSVSGEIQRLVGYSIKSQTHVAQGQYVLKRTLSISNFYNGGLPGDSAESLFTTDDILGFGMPEPIANKVAGAFEGDPHDGYLWSWRELPSTMVTAAQNRIEVSTEWWHGEWSTDFYNVA